MMKVAGSRSVPGKEPSVVVVFKAFMCDTTGLISTWW
jgi:hypothetical protein